MKKLLFTGALILIVFILIPVVMLHKSENKTSPPVNSVSHSSSTQDEPKVSNTSLSDDDIIYIATYASNFLDINDNTELKKSVLSICKNNFLYYKNSETTPEKLKISNYNDTLFEELSEMVTKIDITLRFEEHTVYIPILRNSGTVTGASDEFPYMVSVASPWEMFSKNFSRFTDYPCGVSVYGMSYLADSGLSSEEILRWYLPLFTVK